MGRHDNGGKAPVDDFHIRVSKDLLGKYQAVRAWFEESGRISKGAKVEFFACLVNAAYDSIEEDRKAFRIRSALEEYKAAKAKLEVVLEEIHPDDKAAGLTPTEAAEVAK